jgi:hypothetical protein
MQCGNAVLAHALQLKDTPFDQHNHSHEVTTPPTPTTATITTTMTIYMLKGVIARTADAWHPVLVLACRF